MTIKGNILDIWDVTPDELTQLIGENPSLRGMIVGYLAEYKLRKWLSLDNRISKLRKDDDHDRTRKGDMVVTYKSRDFIIESKSLQTNSIKRNEDGSYSGKYQCDASDRRTIKLKSGKKIETTCLKFGEFDIIAVPLYGFTGNWDFGFAFNRDLTASRYRMYPEEVRTQLIASLQEITLPLRSPYTNDLFGLLDNLISERKRS